MILYNRHYILFNITFYSLHYALINCSSFVNSPHIFYFLFFTKFTLPTLIKSHISNLITNVITIPH